VVDRDQEVGPTISPSQGKLAEQVARALRDDIERAGWPIGSVVGSEIDLLTRFGVSRAIIREAVRILEHHGAARTKRGPGGGLVVTAPDLDAIRRSGMLYLEYAGVTGDAVVEMRTVVEAAMARTAALRISPASADRLRAAIAAEGAAGETVSNFLDFHSELASAAGNRLAQLFVALLSDLVPMHFEESQHSPSAMAAIAVATHRAHERIVEAVVAGDPDAAERRMRRHLVASSDALH
jgi:DNA-binding FadR family transcriptional regulator